MPAGTETLNVHAHRARTQAAIRIVAIALGLAAQLFWERQPLPLGLRFTHAAVLGLSLWRTDAALLIVAGLGPLSGALTGFMHSLTADGPSHVLGSTLTGGPLLQIMFLALLTGAWIRNVQQGQSSRLVPAMTVLGLLAVASACAVLPARIYADVPDDDISALLNRAWHGEDFTQLRAWRPFFAAALTIEGLCIAWLVEGRARLNPVLGRRLLGALLAGHAGMAILNLLGVIGWSVARADSWGDLLVLVRSYKISLAVDPNSAASVFVMVTVGGMALLSSRTRWRPAVAGLMLFTLAGVWLAGSRMAYAALLAGPALVAATSNWLRPDPRRKAGRWIAVWVAAVITVAAVVLTLPSMRAQALPVTASGRWITASAALKMASTAPVFGVGIGTFWDRSVEFGTAELHDRLHLPDTHENAHNNFLQILAEQGLAGLAATLAVLAVIFGDSRCLASRDDRYRFWEAAALAAFLLTWLSGHPMLVPEGAIMFWLFAGMLAGLAPIRSSPVSGRWLTALTIAILLTIPVRSIQAFREQDFSHVGLGLSEWIGNPEAGGYRTARRVFSLYIPSNRLVGIPMRRTTAAPDPLTLEFKTGGRLLNATRLPSTTWQIVTLEVPSRRQRFVRVDFVVRTSSDNVPDVPCVEIGMDVSR